MNKGFEELNQYGIKGIAAFWFRILLLLLPIGLTIFSIVWIVQTSNKIWINSIGGQILTANVFLVIISLASSAFLLLCWMDKQILISVQFTHHLFAISSFIGQVICCILMSLSSTSSSETYIRSIEDYCVRNPSNSVVTKFISNNPSEYSRYKYVSKRSTDLYPSISSFFGIWFASTITYLLCSTKLTELPPEQSPLLNDQQQQQQEDHPESEHHDDHPHDQEQPENGDHQPWILNPGNESHNEDDNEEGNIYQDEVNITTNSHNTEPRLNGSQGLNSANPGWVNRPETENPEDSKNPSWAKPQSDTGAVQNYEYSYEEEEEV